MTNVLPSVPSSTQLRAMLEEMVLNDLLGPVGGPEEEIDEQSVRDRYLVGMLAPKRQELSPEQFDELPQDSFQERKYPMSLTEVVVEGTLKPDGTLELDQKPSLSPDRVKVILQPAQAG